jgi:hypothetical protein
MERAYDHRQEAIAIDPALDLAEIGLADQRRQPLLQHQPQREAGEIAGDGPGHQRHQQRHGLAQARLQAEQQQDHHRGTGNVEANDDGAFDQAEQADAEQHIGLAEAANRARNVLDMEEVQYVLRHMADQEHKHAGGRQDQAPAEIHLSHIGLKPPANRRPSL